MMRFQWDKVGLGIWRKSSLALRMFVGESA